MIELASRRSLRGLQSRERALLAPEAVSLDDGIWWGGNDVAAATTLTITGSQTIAEAAPFSADPKLSVTAISGVSAGDMNCVLFPRTIATGQIWRCRIRIKGTLNVFTMGMFVFTDGVVGTSNAVGALRYINSSSSQALAGGYHGTLTAFTTSVGENVLLTNNDALDVDRVLITDIEYTSANTFAVRYRDESLVEWFAVTGIAKTITPTHIAVCWSNWGGAGSAREVHFGPVYRVA